MAVNCQIAGDAAQAAQAALNAEWADKDRAALLALHPEDALAKQIRSGLQANTDGLTGEVRELRTRLWEVVGEGDATRVREVIAQIFDSKGEITDQDRHLIFFEPRLPKVLYKDSHPAARSIFPFDTIESYYQRIEKFKISLLEQATRRLSSSEAKYLKTATLERTEIEPFLDVSDTEDSSDDEAIDPREIEAANRAIQEQVGKTQEVLKELISAFRQYGSPQELESLQQKANKIASGMFYVMSRDAITDLQ